VRSSAAPPRRSDSTSKPSRRLPYLEKTASLFGGNGSALEPQGCSASSATGSDNVHVHLHDRSPWRDLVRAGHELSAMPHHRGISRRAHRGARVDCACLRLTTMAWTWESQRLCLLVLCVCLAFVVPRPVAALRVGKTGRAMPQHRAHPTSSRVGACCLHEVKAHAEPSRPTPQAALAIFGRKVARLLGSSARVCV